MIKKLAGAALLSALFFACSVQEAARLPAKIGYEELASLLADPKSDLLLLYVCNVVPFSAGHIPGAVAAREDKLATTFSEPNKDRPIVVYCSSGKHSAMAIIDLEGMGYTQVSDFGAFANWKGPVVKGD